MTLPPLKCELIDANQFRLLEDLHFLGFLIPAGFEFDGQSWSIGEKKALRAAAIHDWLYKLNGARDPYTGLKYSRKEADKIFRAALKENGVNPVSRWTRFIGLRVFGRFAWNGHKKRNEEKNRHPEFAGLLK